MSSLKCCAGRDVTMSRVFSSAGPLPLKNLLPSLHPGSNSIILFPEAGPYYEKYYLHHTGLHFCRTDLCLSGKKNEGRLYTLTAGIRHSRYGSHIVLFTDNIFLTRIFRDNFPRIRIDLTSPTCEKPGLTDYYERKRQTLPDYLAQTRQSANHRDH